MRPQQQFSYDDDDGEIAYFSVRWKTSSVYCTKTKNCK